MKRKFLGIELLKVSFHVSLHGLDDESILPFCQNGTLFELAIWVWIKSNEDKMGAPTAEKKEPIYDCCLASRLASRWATRIMPVEWS